MLKKITLLAMAIGALVAFAVPAVASADAWTLNGSTVGASTAEGVTFDGAGSLSATTTLPNGVPLEFGPCAGEYHGTVWNEEVEEELVGHGEIESITGSGTCEVWILNGPGGTTGTTLCAINNMTKDTEPAWTVTTSGSSVTVEGVNWTSFFNEGCALGASSGGAGTATGVFSGGSISVSGSADDITSTSTGKAIDLDGSVTITPTAGGTLTLD